MAKRQYNPIRSAEEKKLLLDEIAVHQAHGKSTEEACRMVGVKSGTYYNWRHEVKVGKVSHHKQKDRSVPVRKTTVGAFVADENTKFIEIPVTLRIPISLGDAVIEQGADNETY